jgi:FkbM family methyltransferase
VDYDCYQLERCCFKAGSPGVVIDAGANVGVSAIVLADRFPGRVLCMEPVPENCEWLRRNIERNAVSRAEVLPIGLAGRSRRDWIWRDPEQSVSGHFDRELSPQSHHGLLGSEADFLSISDLLSRTGAKEVVLLKLDVEGAEHEIIDALDPTTARQIQQITMEVHDLDRGRNSRRMARKLQSLGYQIWRIPERLGRKNLSHILAQRK